MNTQATDEKARARQQKRDEAAQLKERLAALKERSEARDEAERLAPKAAPVGENSELFTQVGTTPDGSPLYARHSTEASTPGAYPGKTNTLAILALVFGLVGGIAAIPLGHVALSQIKRTREGGRGMALTGLVLGYIWVATVVISYIVFAVILAQSRAK